MTSTSTPAQPAIRIATPAPGTTSTVLATGDKRAACANCHKRILKGAETPWFHRHSLAGECAIL